MPILFAYLGLKLQKHVDEVLKSRQTKDLRGGARIDWVSLLEKHKNNIPFIASLFGALTGSSKFTGIYLTTLYSQVNNRYFGAIERAQAAIKVKEAGTLIEAFDLSPKLTGAEKIEGYKLIIQDILTFDSKGKIFFSILGFVSMLAYFFTANLFVFGQLIIALMSLIKEGKISKSVAKTIVRMLRLKGVPFEVAT